MVRNGKPHVADPGEGTILMGGYQGLWNDLDIGSTLDGFTLNQTTRSIPITTDLIGAGKFEDLSNGLDLTVSVVLQNWNAQAIEDMIWWHGNSTPANYAWGTTDGPGQSHWNAAKPLILTACAAVGGSSSDSTGISEENPAGNTVIVDSTGADAANPFIDPLDIVFFKTLLRPDEGLEILLANRPRFIELTLDVYPIKQLDSNPGPNEPDKVERPNGCGRIQYFSATRGASPSGNAV